MTNTTEKSFWSEKRYWLSEIEHKVKLLWWQEKGLQYTRSGFGGKIPTPMMVRLPDCKIWRRVYMMIYSNLGTCYIMKNNKRIIIEE